jgi:hypothetical protein
MQRTTATATATPERVSVRPRFLRPLALDATCMLQPAGCSAPTLRAPGALRRFLQPSRQLFGATGHRCLEGFQIR